MGTISAAGAASTLAAAVVGVVAAVVLAAVVVEAAATAVAASTLATAVTTSMLACGNGVLWVVLALFHPLNVGLIRSISIWFIVHSCVSHGHQPISGSQNSG